MPLSNLVVFPLFGIVPGDPPTCACGDTACKRVGKHPSVKWGAIRYGDPSPRPAPGAGTGLKTGAAPLGSGVFVVDIDSDTAATAFDAMGECPETFTVLTGRGVQLYFKHPGFYVKNSAGRLCPRVDIRGDGGFVVAPGGPHKNGRTYEAVSPDLEPADAPAWLLAWLRTSPANPSTPPAYSRDVSGDERTHRLRSYAAWLASEAPPCVEGEGGDGRLFEVVQRGAYDYALPTVDVLEAIREHYDPRCTPMWGDELDERVLHKAHDAKTRSTRPRVFEPIPADAGLLGTEPSMRPVAMDAVAAQKDASAGRLDVVRGGWDAPIGPPPYLVQGLIPANKVITFFAEGGSLKTWAMLSLGIAVATGENWLGIHPVTKGRVLYLDWEDGDFELRRRMHLLTGSRDVPDLWYRQGAPRMNQEELWRLVAPLVEQEGVTFIIADALRSGTTLEVDENSTQFAEGVIRAGAFTNVGPGCTVGIVHHANKSGGLRGSSAVRDQSDVVFDFEAVSELEGGIKRMRMACNKPGPQLRPKPVNLELSNAHGLIAFDDGLKPLHRASSIADLRAHILLKLADGPMLRADLREALGCGMNKLTEALSSLQCREGTGQVQALPGLGYALIDRSDQ